MMRKQVELINEQLQCPRCRTPMRVISVSLFDEIHDELRLKCERCEEETALVGTRRHRELIDVPS